MHCQSFSRNGNESFKWLYEKTSNDTTPLNRFKISLTISDFSFDNLSNDKWSLWFSTPWRWMIEVRWQYLLNTVSISNPYTIRWPRSIQTDRLKSFKIFSTHSIGYVSVSIKKTHLDQISVLYTKIPAISEVLLSLVIDNVSNFRYPILNCQHPGYHCRCIPALTLMHS